jgi:hypothetical protein
MRVLPGFLTLLSILVFSLLTAFICGSVDTSSASTGVFLLRLNLQQVLPINRVLGAGTLPSVIQFGLWGGCIADDARGNPGDLVGDVDCFGPQETLRAIDTIQRALQVGSSVGHAVDPDLGDAAEDRISTLSKFKTAIIALDILSIIACLLAFLLAATSLLVSCLFQPRPRTHSHRHGRSFWTRVPFFMSSTLSVLTLAAAIVAHIATGYLQSALSPASAPIGVTAFVLIWMAFIASSACTFGWIYQRYRLLANNLS